MTITTIPFLHDEVARIRNELKLEPVQIRAGSDAFTSLSYLASIDGDPANVAFDLVPVVQDVSVQPDGFVVDQPLAAP